MPVRKQSLAKRGVLIDRDRLGTARLSSQQSPVGPVDITTADRDDTPGDSDKPRDRCPGIILAYRKHVHHYIGRWIAQAGREVENRYGGPRTVDVADARGKTGLMEAAMIDGGLMPAAIERGHHVRSDEVGSTNHQNPHACLTG